MNKLEIVAAIGDKSDFAASCRGLNNRALAAQLLDACGVSYDKIHEVPLSWNNQVAVVYSIGGNYHEFACGLSTIDGVYFEVDEAIDD